MSFALTEFMIGAASAFLVIGAVRAAQIFMENVQTLNAYKFDE